jgi:translation initiation factor 3 subunit B
MSHTLHISLQNWTETSLVWSPLGTYLTTFHRQGIQTWGGASWNRIQRFPHRLVRLLDFSPNETYLVTWSPDPITLPPEGHPDRANLPFDQTSEDHTICIWETRTGELLRTFPPIQTPEDVRPTWPFFKFSADEKYVARIHPGKQISIYELPGMRLLDNNSIKIAGVKDFEWAPSRIPGEKKAGADEQYMLCYWMPEQGNSPAKVALMNVPSKEIVRTKNLFNVSDVNPSLSITLM